MAEGYIYGLLAVLELAFILSGLAGWLFYRNREAGRKIAALKKALRERPMEVEKMEAVTSDGNGDEAAYADFLREQLEQSGVMLGEEGAAGGDEGEDPVRQMLAARHQFLQLELDAQAMAKDPEARRKHLVEGMQALLESLMPAAAATGTQAAEGGGEPEAGRVAREQELEAQLSHLRDVIDNQHEVMKELKQLLKETMGDVPEVQELLRKLEDAEAQSLEMQQSIEAMKGGLVSSGIDHSPDADMLRDLIGNQQQTIANLQNMMANLIPEAEASEGLSQAIDKMQRANQELGTCVMVLEDENNRLRSEVETLQKKVDELATGVVEPVEEEATDAPAEEPAGEAADAVPESGEADEAAAASMEPVQEAQPQEAPDAAADAEDDELDVGAFVELDTGGAAEPQAPDGDEGAGERDLNMPPPEAVALEDEDGGVAEDDIDSLLEEAFADENVPGKGAAGG